MEKDKKCHYITFMWTLVTPINCCYVSWVCLLWNIKLRESVYPICLCKIILILECIRQHLLTPVDVESCQLESSFVENNLGRTEHWHRLPREGMGSPSLEIFKNHLRGPWQPALGDQDCWTKWSRYLPTSAILLLSENKESWPSFSQKELGYLLNQGEKFTRPPLIVFGVWEVTKLSTSNCNSWKKWNSYSYKNNALLIGILTLMQ